MREQWRGTSIVGSSVKYSRELESRMLVEMLRSLSISHQQRFFDRRVERVVWHPRCRTSLAVGSHGGDVFLWNYEDDMRTAKIVDGCGRGGAINDMKFSHSGDRLYTVGHDGVLPSPAPLPCAPLPPHFPLLPAPRRFRTRCACVFVCVCVCAHTHTHTHTHKHTQVNACPCRPYSRS